MHQQTMRIANAVIGVSLLVLLAAALIAGQARGRLPYETFASSGPDAQPSHGLILTRSSVRNLKMLPDVVDTMLALPLTIENGVDGVTVRPELSRSPKHLAE